jgi:autotransporter-associated beta strand protein
VFNAAGTEVYTATNDLGAFTLNGLTLGVNSTAVVTLDGTQVNFVANGGTFPSLNVTGGGAAIMSAPLNLGGALTIGGTGTGALALSGNLTGAGSLTLNRVAGSVTTLSGTNGSTGPLTLTSGTLAINAVTQVGTGALSLGNGTLQYNSTTSATLPAFSATGARGVIAINGASTTLTLAGLTGNGTVVLTVTPPSANLASGFAFASANGTFTGNLIVGNGSLSSTPQTTLSIGADNQLGAVGTIVAANNGNLVNTASSALTLNRQLLFLSSSQFDTGTTDVTLNGDLAGASTLTKIGISTLTLTTPASFSAYRDGTLSLSAGTLRLTAANGLSRNVQVSGAVGSTFDLNNTNQEVGYLGSTVTSGQGLSIALGTGTLTAGSRNSAGTVAGVISGGGSFIKIGTAAQTLTGANTYTGATAVRAGGLTLSGADGGILGSTNVSVAPGGTLTLTNTTTLPTNADGRLNNNTVLSLGGTFLLSSSSAGLSSNEVITTLQIPSDTAATVSLTAGTTSFAQLSAQSLLVGPRATVLFRGTTLGSGVPGTNNTTNVVFTTAPTLVGGGGAAGTPNVSILPFAFGDSSGSGNGNNLVTYDGTNGVRLLNTTTEFALTMAAVTGTTNNVRLTADETTSSSQTINALTVFTPSGSMSNPRTLTGTAGTTLTIGTGLVLLATTNTNTASNLTITGYDALNFGSTAVLHVGGSTTPRAVIQTPLNGSQGLIKAGNGVLEIAAANNITGGLVLGNGTLIASHAQALGTGPITLNAGTLTATVPLTASGPVTLAGNLVNFAGGATNAITFTGNVTTGPTANVFEFNTGTVAASAGLVTLTSVVSGAGTLRKRGTQGDLTLAGANTFTGGVFHEQGGLIVGNNQALGTGTLTIERTTGTVGPFVSLSAIGGARTLSNRVIMYSDTGTIAFNGTDALTFTGAVTLGASGSSSTSTPGFIDFTRTLQVNNTTTFTNTITHDFGLVGNLTKTGTGTLVLAGTSSYTGTTTVNAGTLRVNGTLAASNSVVLSGLGPVVNVDAAGTLAGNGTIQRVTSVATGGTLAPGADATTPGNLTISRNTTLAGGTTLAIAANNTTASRLVLNLGAALDLSGLSASTPLTIALTDVGLGAGPFTFTVIDTGATPINFGTGFNAANFAVTATNFSFGGTPVVLNPSAGVIQVQFTPVPEPLTLVLGGLVGAGWCLRRGKRRFRLRSQCIH